jgi:beta-lactamase regulating signal transducer with metallopeptidase domain
MSAETMPVVETLSWTLIHFLWQGSIVVLLLAVVNAALKRRSANLRYLMSCGALLLMFALPLGTFVFLYSDPAMTIGATHDVLARFKTPERDSLTNGFATRFPGAGGLIESKSQARNTRELFLQFAPWLTSLWLAGVLSLSLRMLGGWLYARRLQNYLAGPLSLEWQRRFEELSRQIRVLRPVRFLESALVQVPTVIGWLRPLVLIPASALAGLTPRQLEAVIAHELAHIRRYDYLVNLLQTAVEILLFYHPAVWWVSREIRREREHCCDDVAVQVCNDALVYARALAEIETLRSVSPRLVMAADGASLVARIQRLVGKSPQRPEQMASWLPGAIVLAFVLALLAGGQFLSGYTEASESASTEATPSTTAASAMPATENLRVATRQHNASGKQAAKSETSDEIDPTENPSSEAAPPIEPQASKGSGSFIEELAALGYTNLSVDDLIALKNHGVTVQFIRELKENGYEKISIGQLTRLASMGVSGQFIRELKAAGIAQLPIESLIRLHNHGVNPALIKELGDLGYKNLSPDQLSTVASHGVTAKFIGALQSAGYKDLPIDEVVRAHDHGVSPDFIKEIRDLGYTGLTLNQVVRMKDHGVDAEFIRAIEAAGFGRLPVDEIVRARDHGADPEFIKKMQSAGYPKASLEQLIRAKDHGVTPGYIESVKKAGYTNVSIDQLIRMHDHGIDAQFIERAKAHGFQNLSLDQLVRLRDADVIK